VQAPELIDPMTLGTVHVSGTETEARALFGRLTG
jgi:hypothetical protein